MTKIYHPNIDEKGQVCIPYIKPENWRPATRIEQMIEVSANLEFMFGPLMCFALFL
nr:unnamed protein product [Callosobruchus analis]